MTQPAKLIFITGGPHSGKTTFSQSYEVLPDHRVVHTDDFAHLPWDEQPQAAWARVVKLGSMGHIACIVVEGVTAARMLPKDPKIQVVIPISELIYLENKSPDPAHAGLYQMVKNRVEKYLTFGKAVFEKRSF